MADTVRIADLEVGPGCAPLLVAGPCVIESRDETMEIARRVAALADAHGFQFVFKASYLKDNRTSAESYRGPGLDAGLEILAAVRDLVGCPVLSDVHAVAEVAPAAEVLDVLQVPAFLCRQTSLIEAVARSARPVNVKKGPFVAPEAMVHVAGKFRAAGGRDLLLTERGTTFGYGDLVVDFRGFSRMRAARCPVVLDVTHSLQRPGALGAASGGEPDLAPLLARAAAAVPVDGFFLETHPDPARARSDAASMLPLDALDAMLGAVARIHALAREIGPA